MSAYVVHNHHVDALLTAGLTWRHGGSPVSWWHPDLHKTEVKTLDERNAFHRELTVDTVNDVGRLLLTANELSVAYHYRETPDLLWIDEYEFERLPGAPDPLVVLNALGTYEYQACEHPGWRDSEAAAIIDALRTAAIEALPGYRDHAWGDITDRLVFVKGTRAAA